MAAKYKDHLIREAILSEFKKRVGVPWDGPEEVFRDAYDLYSEGCITLGEAVAKLQLHFYTA